MGCGRRSSGTALAPTLKNLLLERGSTVRYTGGMATVQPITTADQLFQAPDLGRCELLRGELIMMSPAGSKHGMIVAEIAAVSCRDFVEPRRAWGDLGR